MFIRVAVLQTKVSLLDLMTEAGRTTLGVSSGDCPADFRQPTVWLLVEGGQPTDVASSCYDSERIQELNWFCVW